MVMMTAPGTRKRRSMIKTLPMKSDPLLHVRFDSSIKSSSIARSRLKSFITEKCGIPLSDDVHELLTAVGEAVSNAWRHGCGCGQGNIFIDAIYERELKLITVEISDPGSGFDITMPFRPGPIEGVCACGRFLMQEFTDSVAYDRRGDHFVCILTKTLAS